MWIGMPERSSLADVARIGSLLGAGALLAGPSAVHGQAFLDNKARIPAGAPGNLSVSENVDFADIDLDGDWDAAFADGGECCNDQNRIWVNRGGLQGGPLAFFDDETAQRAPAIGDDSNDVEFADWDADGDPDLYVSNTSEIVNQSSRFWTNVGGSQAGTLGYFADETDQRWVDLDGAGSSIAATLLIPSGGFIDWSSDADFADLDNDGDLDLVHSSYGSLLGGLSPTRLFLNDGSGRFAEFNPQRTKLQFSVIAPGTPAIWCEGAQAHDTTDTTGLFADIATTALDVELGDIDGDLDLDLILGDLVAQPRVFENRLESGQLAFRDVTGSALTQATPEPGNYDQALADLDGDLDLDLYCLGWLQWTNGVALNDGTGVFGPVTPSPPGTDQRHVEATLLDYDGDGDLDAFAAGITVARDRLFENDGAGAFTDVSEAHVPPTADERSRGGDAVDVDGDGDPDLFVATEDRNLFLWNLGGVPDATPPTLTRLETGPDRIAGPEPSVVRVQLFDNATPEHWQSARVWLEVGVDGGPVFDVPMQSSGGGVFRAEILGWLVGAVGYRAVALDSAGNLGVSTSTSFQALPGPMSSLNTTYCTAKTSSLGCVPRASIEGLCSVGTEDPCWLLADQVLNHRNGLWFYGFASVAVPFLGGTLCVSPPLRRTELQNSGGNPPPGDCSGRFVADLNAWIASGIDPQLVPGADVHAQWWFRDNADPTGSGLTDAVHVVVQP